MDVIYPEKGLKLIRSRKKPEEVFDYDSFGKRNRNRKYREYQSKDEDSEENYQTPRGEREEARRGKARQFMDEWEMPEDNQGPVNNENTQKRKNRDSDVFNPYD